MATPVKIVNQNGRSVRVTDFGQLVVASVGYSIPINSKLDVINTAFNLVGPSAGQQIVVTDIILTANKNVGASDATVDIYTATAIDATTVTTSILQLEMQKNTSLSLNGLNLITSDGVWLNAKTDDNDVFVTLMYYRVPVKDN